MNATAVPVTDIASITHDEAERLAATEYDRLIGAIDALGADDWGRQTVNDLWDVKAMLGHVLGMMKGNADPAEMGRQQAVAGEQSQRNGTFYIDELTGLQVREHADLSSEAVAAALKETAPKALAGRFGVPEAVLATPLNPGPPFKGEWTLGFLLETILTRDTWMHRADLCQATGQEFVLTAEHDGRLVADVVREWAATHGQPFTLVLTGPAGGTYTQGQGGEHIELDAVEFCRILSGRGSGDGLLKTEVPF